MSRRSRSGRIATSLPTLSDREFELLLYLDDEHWLRPMDVGGRDGSHHSATLAQLARKGLAERKKSCMCGPGSEIERSLLAAGVTPRWPWCRCTGSCRYRRTPAGRTRAVGTRPIDVITKQGAAR